MTEILLATINDIVGSGVTSFNTRTGDVTLQAADAGSVLQVAQVSHQWLQALGADGTWTQSQPSFADLSGTASPSQLPLATASAFGVVKPDGTTITISGGVISAVGGGSGVSSFNTRTGAVTLAAADVGAVCQIAAVSHKFITAFSAAGAFTLAQPAFTDISGSVAATQMPALTGDVTSTAGTVATTIASNAVTNAKLAQMAANTIKGNNTGSTANAADLTPAQVTTMLGLAGAFEFIIDGGGATIATGLWKGYFEVPYACTITIGTLLADESGSISIDVLKTTFASFDAGATHPVAADKISASAPLAISSSTKSQDSTLTGWTKSLSAGDIIGFNISSVTSIQRVTVSLRVVRS